MKTVNFLHTNNFIKPFNMSRVAPRNEPASLEYEMNQQGQNVLIRSVESRKQVYLRFTNKTSRPVSIWWRDFRGRRQFYSEIRPRGFYHVASYVSHPWQFTDTATGERFVINNKLTFRAPDSLGGMRYRSNWYVTVQVRSLRHIALMTVASLCKPSEKADELELPRILIEEVKDLANKLYPPPPESLRII